MVKELQKTDREDPAKSSRDNKNQYHRVTQSMNFNNGRNDCLSPAFIKERDLSPKVVSERMQPIEEVNNNTLISIVEKLRLQVESQIL